MQVFLPYADFAKSARVLDDVRLRKQRIEAGQILKTLEGESDAWKNHPAVKMFDGFSNALFGYKLEVEAECFRRGFKSNHDPSVVFCDSWQNPPWFGDERLHSSHRARLLFKGRVDATAYSLKSFLKVPSIDACLLHNCFPVKHLLKKADIEDLEAICKDYGLLIAPNHYRQFGWKEQESDGGYWWPTKNL